MPWWGRYPCMAFGLLTVFGGAKHLFRNGTQDTFPILAAFLVGGVWFAFGSYGGLPMVNTVHGWHPTETPNEVNDTHRRGLLVMRRRRWLTRVSLPVAFVAVVYLMPKLIQIGKPELILFIVGVPLFVGDFRYLLSRCPRCGYGFFTRGTSRAAFLNLRKTSGHCDLSLYAYKDRNP